MNSGGRVKTQTRMRCRLEPGGLCQVLALLALALVDTRGEAPAFFTPVQRVILAAPPAPPVEAPFRFDAPPRPPFTAEERAAQRERGKGLLPLVVAAHAAGAAEVRLPPGEYRFPSAEEQGARSGYALCFDGLQRPDDQPLVVEATGVTLWFDLPDTQMPPGHRCVGFRNCRNLVLRGAVLARATPGQIEGRITRIDRANNRLEIQPSPGVTVPTTYNGGEEQRVLPFKSDGRFCAPLYDLQPGIRRLRYTDIRPSEDGRHWVALRDPDLLARIHDEDWARAQGDLGVLRVGDGICCLYVTGASITLENSANLTLHGLRVFVDKGGPVEIGGDGGHLWKDCYFGPQPGTCQWKGADGFLSRSLRHGSTLDHVTIRHTADDLANFHGVWGRVESVSDRTLTLVRDATLRPTLDNARAGDRLRFFHASTAAFLGEARVVSLKEFSVTLDRDAAPFAGARASWPEHECAGWVVSQCRWEDSFQRLLIMSGPGTVRGNTFARWGAGISLNTGMGTVGGIPSGIVIANNLFTDVAPRPLAAVISARAHNGRGREGVPPIEGLVISGNTFFHHAQPALELVGLLGGRIENNQFVSPPSASVEEHPTGGVILRLRACGGLSIQGNFVRDGAGQGLLADRQALDLDGTQGLVLDGQPVADAPLRRAQEQGR